jgi:DNA (cytosine-5)-methyltransferase 1
VKRGLRIGSLFAGIGGLELGLEWAGVGHTVWQVEIDPFCRDVLATHWPDAQRFEDVRAVGAHNLERVDVICGGFPCVEISSAGKKRGHNIGASSLWKEMIRVVSELHPRFVVIENAADLRLRGLGEILGCLDAIGYDAEWHTIASCALGAPHSRKRLFVVAYANDRNEPDGSVNAETPGVCEVPRCTPDWGTARAAPLGVDDGLPGRTHRLHALGNAVVPQVAEVVGRRLLQIAAGNP